MSDLELSYVGAPPPTLPTANLFDFIFSNPLREHGPVSNHAPDAQSRNHIIPNIAPHKPLLVDPLTAAQVSWDRVRIDSLRIAAGLHALDLQPSPAVPHTSTGHTPIISPVVLLHLPNSLAFAPLLFGVMASGLTVTMANPALTSGELAWILKSSEPKVVVTTPEGLQVLNAAITESDSPQVKANLINTRRVYIVDPAHDEYGLPCSHSKGTALDQHSQDWKALLAHKPLRAPVQFKPSEYKERTAVILWSSGTSGKSKGVVLSHQALVSNVHSLWHINQAFDGNQRWLGFAPFYHIFALCNVLLLAVASGATIFVMPKFDPKLMLSHVQRFRVTFLHMAPPVAVLLAKSPMLDEYDMTSIRGAVSGGAPLPSEIVEQVYRRLGILIKLGYGLSEAGSVCNQVGETWEVIQPQLGNTGVPCFGIELKIVSVDDPTKIVAKGLEGEILIRSPTNMTCYLNNKAATDEALDSEGWFHTGDVGKVDANGHLWITDRLKDVMKVKGFQVSPSELENILCGSPSIADAAVCGLFDAGLASELPRAYVVPSSKHLLAQCTPNGLVTPELQALAQEIKQLVESKTVRYKWLTGNVVFVPAVPKSPSGKILRRMLVGVQGVESTNGLCSGTANTTFYTDSCGQQYQVYCSADSSPGAYATLDNVPDFATCMSYCSAAGSSVCTTVTYVGTACYLKQSFSTIIRPSSGNTATIYYAPPSYPAPVANGQYRSSGCGTPLNSAISAGGASSVFYGNGSDGYVHSYNVHVPSGYDPNKAAPLILVFHGRGESAIQDSTGQPTWQGDPSYVGNTTINDLNFVRTLVANISSQYCIDTSRVFAAGFSNGGGLVNVLACDPVMSTVFNAFAPHSGAYYTQTSDSNTACFLNTVLTNDLVHSVCSPSGRVPMIEFHGDNDGVIPYFGGGRRGYCLPAIPHWSQDWATRNNLTTDNVTTVTNGGNVTKAEFGSLSGLLGLVTQFRLAGWPHEYSLGSNSGPIDAAAFSLDFFYRWTNPAGPSQDYLSSIYASTTSARHSHDDNIHKHQLEHNHHDDNIHKYKL
ncbi:acetyl-CoA synthetase-like protein, partial [Aureobasidium melanogenum]